MDSDTFPFMRMQTCGDLRLHYGRDGIRLTRLSGPIKTISTREAGWLATMLPLIVHVVEKAEGDER